MGLELRFLEGQGRLLNQEKYLEIFVSDLGWFGSYSNFNHVGSNTMWYALAYASLDNAEFNYNGIWRLKNLEKVMEL